MSHTVAQVAENIAKFVDRSWPNDRHDMYSMMDLIQDAIWKSGLFKGSTKWFYASVRNDNTIITPHGYNVLLGAQVGFTCSDQVARIQDEFFFFKENGPVHEPCEGVSYSRDIQHMGEYPTLLNFYDDSRIIRDAFTIGVISEGSPGYANYPKTVVSALGCEGKPIYSYGASQQYKLADGEDVDNMRNMQLQGEDFYTETDILEGLQFPITCDFNIRHDVHVTSIYNIAKDPTLSEVKYYAVRLGQCKGLLIASLGPFQTSSVYNIYKILSKCVKNSQAFCLFKVSKPEKIVSDNQFFLTDNITAQINFAKYIYYSYYKNDLQKGLPFFELGLADLAKEITASEPAKAKVINIQNNLERARRERKFG